MNLELQEAPADTYANVWSRENLVVMQRNSVPGLQADAPALGFGYCLDLFCDVFGSLVDMDAIELGTVAGEYQLSPLS